MAQWNLGQVPEPPKTARHSNLSLGVPALRRWRQISGAPWPASLAESRAPEK